MRRQSRFSARGILVVVAALLVVVVDQILKSNSANVIINVDGWLGLQTPPFVRILGYLGLIMLIGYLYWRQSKDIYPILLMAILGSSNIYDRTFHGGVRDYLQLGGVWFNLADAGITLIVVVVLINILRKQYES